MRRPRSALLDSGALEKGGHGQTNMQKREKKADDHRKPPCDRQEEEKRPSLLVKRPRVVKPPQRRGRNSRIRGQVGQRGPQRDLYCAVTAKGGERAREGHLEDVLVGWLLISQRRAPGSG